MILNARKVHLFYDVTSEDTNLSNFYRIKLWLETRKYCSSLFSRDCILSGCDLLVTVVQIHKLFFRPKSQKTAEMCQNG